MKITHKLFATLLFLILGLSSFAQLVKTEHDNVLIFRENETLNKNFSEGSYGGRLFNYFDDKYLVITSPKDFIDKNYKALAVYENNEYKNTFSFDYKTNTRYMAYYNDDLYIPTTDPEKGWIVLCKLNMKTQQISYLSLPENLRYLSAEDYYLTRFTFDKSAGKLYLFCSPDEGPRYAFPFDLKTGQFLDKILIDAYQHFTTLNGYHYYWDKSWTLFSKKIDDPNSKPKKLSISGTLEFPVVISESELLCFFFKKTKDIVYKTRNDHSEYYVLKNGELIADKDNTYKDIFNTIRNTSLNNAFYFDFKENEGYKKKITVDTYIQYGGATIVKPGFFILPVAASEKKPVVTETPKTSTEPSFEEVFESRVVAFLKPGKSDFITVDPNSWYGKCLEFEKCVREKPYAYFDCKDLKNGLQSLNLDSKLNECEYLYNALTGTRKEYLKIKYGTENYENLKTQLISIKSTIIRVKAQ
jgi:hypothetical protein